MRILVTGGAGYIGSHTVSQLLLVGHEVVVYDNLSTGFREALPPGVDFVFGDVRDKLMLSRIMKDKSIEGVVHFAAKLIVPESISRPIDYYENNTLGVVALSQACVENKVKYVVFSSTAAIYGDVNPEDAPLSEKADKLPLNPYGSSKMMSEQILLDCEKPYGLKTVCLRYFNVAGASLDGTNGQRTRNATHLIKVASEAACGKRASLSLFGTDYPTKDGTCVRDYIHVEDLAELHVLALSYLLNGGNAEVFNCGYGHGFSVKEVIATVKKVSGVDFPVEEVGRRQGDAASLVADSANAKKALGWSPKRDSLEVICRTAYQWECKL